MPSGAGFNPIAPWHQEMACVACIPRGDTGRPTCKGIRRAFPLRTGSMTAAAARPDCGGRPGLPSTRRGDSAEYTKPNNASASNCSAVSPAISDLM